MKKIILNNKGQLIAKDQAYFGGKYSFLSRLKMDGIGSPKVIYRSGIPYFDELAFVENELSFANFELMINGFLIRINRNQKLRYIGFQLHEILNIQLRKVKDENSFLTIKSQDDGLLHFEVPVQHFGAIQSFFRKMVFRDKFELIEE